MNIKIFYGMLIITLLLTPIIIYATAQSKSVTNNITLVASIISSLEASKQQLITLIASVTSSYENSKLLPITINVLCFDTTSLSAYYTIQSSPSALSSVYFDGNLTLTPYAYNKNAGTIHNITAKETIDITPNESRYIYNSWSDGGTRSHNITLPVGNYTYTATFSTQYKLDVTSGTGSGWYYNNTNATSTAYYVKNQVSEQSRDNLISYTLNGSTTNITRSGTNNYTLTNINIMQYTELTWNYETQYYCTLNSIISDLTTSQTGSQTSDDWYDSSTNVNATTTTPQIDGGITYDFDTWKHSLGGVSQSNTASNPLILSMTNYRSITAWWSVATDGNVTVNISANEIVDGDIIYTPNQYFWDINTIHNVTALYDGSGGDITEVVELPTIWYMFGFLALIGVIFIVVILKAQF